MKKYISYLLFFTIISASCSKDLLEKQPLDIITGNTVWNDPALIDAFLTQQYAQTVVMVNETPGYGNAWDGDWFHGVALIGPFYINEVADEAGVAWEAYKGDEVKKAKSGGIDINGGILEWWETSYKTIRSLNELIEKVPTSPLETDLRETRIAEARFLRAFNYLAMVKRYGGVPLITKVQSLSDPEPTLYAARNTEQEIYDFIISEVDDMVAKLPEVAGDYGRATKYAALALKSRAALYAGSIAQYGSMQLNNLLGIPSNLANGYYQKAYDASKLIMSSGKFSLYKADANKVTNFKNIFLVKKNPEILFAVQHNNVNLLSAAGNSWSYDFFQCPKPHGWNCGNMDGPYLEMAEEFEHIDGSSGKLDYATLPGRLWSTDELWSNKDPRFFATIYTQNTPWQGGLVDFHNGLIKPDGSIITDNAFNGVLAVGNQGVDGVNNMHTSFGVMKYLDEKANNTDWVGNASTDYIVFRYAEVLLNLAEAAFELGKTNEALDAVNEIRSRAGIAPLASIDRDKIRHERKVELAFEGHRYWDLRRWRMAATELSKNRSGIKYSLDYNTRKYKVEVVPNYDGTLAPPKFLSKHYYLPVTLKRTGANKNLVENPGY